MVSSVKITEKLSIPAKELMFTACRSSGPGGQNVNKVNTRVTLWFDVVDSPSLSNRQKKMIRNHLPTRMNKAGVLRVVSQKYRSQAQNRNMTVERFVSLLHQALKEDLPRKKMTVPYAARQRRLEEKKRRSLIKHDRSKKISLDD